MAENLDHGQSLDPVTAIIQRFELQRQPLLFVVSGPSGVGKDTVVRGVGLPDHNIKRVITATTRSPREGEQHGREYYFLDEETFQHWLNNDEFVEHSRVYQHAYGVPRFSIADGFNAGIDQLVTVDVQGAEIIKLLFPAAISIFLAPGLANELLQNLGERGSEQRDALQIRTEKAIDEMKKMTKFDYVVINRRGQLPATIAMVIHIIEAERCRVDHRRITD